MSKPNTNPMDHFRGFIPRNLVPEQQVCTYEQAVALRELGVPQASMLYWTAQGQDRDPYLQFAVESDGNQASDDNAIRIVIGKYPEDAAAFTGGELRMLLGMMTISSIEPNGTHLLSADGYFGHGASEAEVRAQVLLTILKDKKRRAEA